MPKFKKGEKVRIRLNSSLINRGRIGTIDEEPKKHTLGFWYMVKFESKGFTWSYFFVPRELESIYNQRGVRVNNHVDLIRSQQFKKSIKCIATHKRNEAIKAK